MAESSAACRRLTFGCQQLRPLGVAETLRANREQMLESLLHPVRVGRLASAPWACAGVGMNGGGRLKVATLLSAVIQAPVGDDWSALGGDDPDGNTDGRYGSATFVAEAAARRMTRLVAAVAGEAASADMWWLTAQAAAHAQSVRLAVAGELSRVAADAAAAAAVAPDNAYLRGLVVATARYRVRSPTDG